MNHPKGVVYSGHIPAILCVVTVRKLLLTPVVLAVAVAAFSPFSPTATAAESVQFGGGLQVTADQVVATVNVPVTPLHEYIGRAFLYDVYGTCWTRRGKARADHQQRIGGGRVPGSSSDYVLRLPPSSETTFTFVTPVSSLLAPGPGPALASITGPDGLIPGVSRIHFRGLEVHASSFGSRVDDTAITDYLPPAPLRVRHGG